MATIDDLANVIETVVDDKIRKTKKQSGSAIATVNSKDVDGTIWVTFEGGVEKTPITTVLADVEPGDRVAVRIEKGRSYIDGNATSPSASVRTVNVVRDMAEDAQYVADDAAKAAGSAIKGADVARIAAEEAKEVAKATGQHFWEDENGAHVTETTKDEWKVEETKPDPFADVSDSKPYHNLLMNSLGIALRTALKNLASITRSAIAFFDGEGNVSANVVASFGKDGAQIGYAASTHSKISANSFGVYEGADRLISFSSDNRLAKMYAGISIPPSYAKYTNAEAAVIYDYIENGVELGQDRQTYNDKDTGEATEYHLSMPMPETLPSVLTFINVLDGDGDTLSSADCGGLFYYYDPLVSDDWELKYDIIFDPQAEAEGPLSIEAGGAELVFTDGYIGGPTPPVSDDSTKLVTTEWVNDLFDTFPLVQRGTVSPSSHAASSSDNAAITFVDEFSTSPTVVVGIRGQTQTEGLGRCSAWASNVSSTGFTLNFRNDFTSARTYGAYWVAVGGGSSGGSGGGGGDVSALEQRVAELEADMQALAEATAYVGANHISIDGTTVSDELNPITSGTIDGMEV